MESLYALKVKSKLNTNFLGYEPKHHHYHHQQIQQPPSNNTSKMQKHKNNIIG